MKAVIFDMDGVIVDSEHQWRLAEGPFFRKLVPRWSDHDHNQIVGMGVVELHDWLVEKHGVKQPKKDFLTECDGLAREIYGQKVSYTDGIAEFLTVLKKKKLKVGLASSSPRPWIDIVLERFGIVEKFAAVASGDETPGKTKPAPDLYLLCARRLGVAPKDCLAIEDSFPGVTAAKAAGMTCAAFRSGHNDEQDLSKADFEFRTFKGLQQKLSTKLC